MIVDRRSCAVVIDPRPLLQLGLAALARGALGGVVHAAPTLEDAATLVRRSALRPRVTLLGLRAGEQPRALVARARAELGGPVIFALSCDDADLIYDALSAETDGYLVIDLAEPDSLRDALEAIGRGERFIPVELQRCGNRRSHPGSVLTPRCTEVMRGLSMGLHDEEVAERLGISTTSVRKHIRGAELRLHAHTRTQAVAMAVRAGVLQEAAGG